jgi:hypothetical protein
MCRKCTLAEKLNVVAVKIPGMSSKQFFPANKLHSCHKKPTYLRHARKQRHERQIRQLFIFESVVLLLFPQGPTFVGTGSGAPEIPELPSSRVCRRVTRPQGDINSGDWPSRLGVGGKARDLTLENTSCYEISNKSDLSEKAKTHKGLIVLMEEEEVLLL